MEKSYLRKSLLISLLLLFSGDICFAAQFPKVQEIYNYLIGAGAGLALLAIIYGGVRFVLSAGDPGLKSEAKTWLIAGVTGLIIIAAAGIIYKGITGEFPPFEVSIPSEIPPVPEEPEGPGVYFYWVPDCLSENGTGADVQSIKIINSENKKFAVVLKNTEDQCQIYSGSGCYNLGGFLLDLIHSYQLNDEAKGEIIFHRRPYYSGKEYKLKNINEIREDIYLSNLVIDDGQCERLYEPDTYCLGSIESSGPYVVVLYNEEDKCEIYELLAVGEEFEGKQTNLKTEKIFSQSKPFKVTIIPSK